VAKITTVVTFLSYCLELEILVTVLLFTTAREMKFEMSSEMENGTAQSYRNGNRIKIMQAC
jgi:hypothetical protein